LAQEFISLAAPLLFGLILLLLACPVLSYCEGRGPSFGYTSRASFRLGASLCSTGASLSSPASSSMLITCHASHTFLSSYSPPWPMGLGGAGAGPGKGSNIDYLINTPRKKSVRNVQKSRPNVVKKCVNPFVDSS